MAEQALLLNYVYLLLDIVMLVLGLLFVAKWGKRGLLAVTLWLFIIGLMALTAGDALATLSENYGTDFIMNKGTYYEVSSRDFAYIPAVIIWIIAFAIPIKFAFFDAKKARAEDQPSAAGPPQGEPGVPAGPQQAPPSPAQQAPVPPPVYQQAPPMQK